MSRRDDLAAMADPVLLASYASSGSRILRRALLGHHRHEGDARAVIRAVIDACWDRDHFDASEGHFRQAWTRDLGFSAGPLVRLGERERVHASLAWALETWARRGRVTTTIFPGRRPRDVYQLGIDSLPLLLHSLRAVAGSDLVARHGSWLRRALAIYADEAIDPRTGLVRAGRRYSTHRDTVRTSSNCYANTMAALLSAVLRETDWFPDPVPPGLAGRLVDVFWRDDRFVDDPSSGVVSGDALVFPFWLGVVQPELGLQAALATAARIGLADPLPLRYVAQRDRAREDPVQRLFVPDYQGTSIWTSLGSMYLSLLDGVDPAAATPGIAGHVALIERDGTFWEVLTDDLRPYRGRLGLFRADEGMLWSAILLEVLERRASREAGGRRQRSSDEADVTRERGSTEAGVTRERGPAEAGRPRDRDSGEAGRPRDRDESGRRDEPQQ